MGVLTGFFIAALAAVATFGKQEMDDPMPGEPPVRLEHTINTETYYENLSRRRFLSFLFGYMAFLTLVLYVVGYVYLITDKYWLSEAAPSWRPTVSGFSGASTCSPWRTCYRTRSLAFSI
ncbi:hypothetical protein [Bradyrhizobium sp. 153]|uniref:hypothetical protein n=1 Tax=Bradyrhizobium sp. 153 TaxID=2782627 RepID=UPI001FF9FBCF|nr:hypothetical protein [Bradyrhizobium sp. 153]MCK1670190.1 hypothetical protein [Bradyrhizobium sp. 153]